MEHVSIIGFDMAKSVFQVHGGPGLSSSNSIQVFPRFLFFSFAVPVK